MQGRLIPNWIFVSVSWLLLFGGMLSVVLAARQVYERHVVPEPAQRFSFSAVSSAAPNARVDLSEVARQHIFGVVPPVKKPVVEKPKVMEAPKTRLKLSLTGVITATEPSRSKAMVEIKRGQTSVVAVGEAIGKTGATLAKVFKDHILIEYRGKTEKLEIIRPKMKISDLRDNSSQTIEALNINVAEFEALAKVDPKDLDISNLLPPPAPKNPQGNVQSDNQNSQTTAADDEINELTLRQMQELEELDRLEEIQELQRILNDGGLEQSEIEELQNELIILQSQQ